MLKILQGGLTVQLWHVLHGLSQTFENFADQIHWIDPVPFGEPLARQFEGIPLCSVDID